MADTVKTSTPGIYHDEKTNTYLVSFYYKDFEGKQHRKLKRGFTTVRQAKEYKRDFLAKMEGSSSMLFSSLTKFYLQDLATKVKPITLKSKTFYVDAYFLPSFKNMSLENINANTIRQWQLKMLKSRKASTVKNLHAQLSSIFRFAMRFYGLKTNPCFIAGNIESESTYKMNFWTVPEFNMFISAMCSDNSRHKMPAQQLAAAFKTLFYTGLRVGELLALTVGDYDKENKLLRITKTVQTIKKQDIITAPKTKKSNRQISLPLELCKILEKHITDLQDQSAEADLFPRLTRAVLRFNIERYSKIAGIKKIRIHDFRHSHASMLVNMAVPIFVISERLGHANIQETINRYSHLYPKTANETAERINEIMLENN